jgi:hypothetical protein
VIGVADRLDNEWGIAKQRLRGQMPPIVLDPQVVSVLHKRQYAVPRNVAADLQRDAVVAQVGDLELPL